MIYINPTLKHIPTLLCLFGLFLMAWPPLTGVTVVFALGCIWLLLVVVEFFPLPRFEVSEVISDDSSDQQV